LELKDTLCKYDEIADIRISRESDNFILSFVLKPLNLYE
jgi:hypothetical protein